MKDPRSLDVKHTRFLFTIEDNEGYMQCNLYQIGERHARQLKSQALSPLQNVVI